MLLLLLLLNMLRACVGEDGVYEVKEDTLASILSSHYVLAGGLGSAIRMSRMFVCRGTCVGKTKGGGEERSLRSNITCSFLLDD